MGGPVPEPPECTITNINLNQYMKKNNSPLFTLQIYKVFLLIGLNCS